MNRKHQKMKAERIGFIGLGSMGFPMAKNLEKAGFNLSVFNRTTSKAAAFESSSTVCSSIAVLAENCDVIFTMLTNDAAVTEVYKEVMTTDITGKLFIDMSTISQKLSVETAAALKTKNASFIDAPVAGSTKPAADGTLIILAGGTQKDIERAMPYFEKMGRLVKHLGENGMGLAAKIAVNYLLAIVYQGLSEAVLLAEKLGLQRSGFMDIINESALGNGVTKIKTAPLVTGDYSPAFALDLMLKDILLAQEAGADFPLGDAAVASYKQAQQDGLGKADVIGIINYLKKSAP
ncbi:MAG: NAD(P)-dependent oxidoreductase [Ferruginibacter sp.]